MVIMCSYGITSEFASEMGTCYITVEMKFNFGHDIGACTSYCSTKQKHNVPKAMQAVSRNQTRFSTTEGSMYLNKQMPEFLHVVSPLFCHCHCGMILQERRLQFVRDMLPAQVVT